MQASIVKIFCVRIGGTMTNLEASGPELQFVENGQAREFFASGLHDVEVMGGNSRFVVYVLRRTPEGTQYREVCFTCVMPNEAIGPAIMLTLKRAGHAVRWNVGKAVKRLLAAE